MFDLDEQSLGSAVLDCCAGASSFVAELVEQGGSAVAVDPVYAVPRAELMAEAAEAFRAGNQIVDVHHDRFVWDWYGTPERRDEIRREAAATFLADFDRRPSRYVAGSLPDLPFADDSYDLVLCSHLLFTWANQFGSDWHWAAITEMLRVARREVRVFPLVVQGCGEDVPFMEGLLERLRADGHDVEIRRGRYVFQQDADSMMIVRPATQGDAVVVTPNTALAAMPGNAFLPASATGLPRTRS